MEQSDCEDDAELGRPIEFTVWALLSSFYEFPSHHHLHVSGVLATAGMVDSLVVRMAPVTGDCISVGVGVVNGGLSKEGSFPENAGCCPGGRIVGCHNNVACGTRVFSRDD